MADGEQTPAKRKGWRRWRKHPPTTQSSKGTSTSLRLVGVVGVPVIGLSLWALGLIPQEAGLGIALAGPAIFLAILEVK